MESDSEDDVLPATDASVAQEIDDLTRRVPKIIGTLPDVFYRSWTSDRRHAAATDEMAKSLLAATEKIKPYALVRSISSMMGHRCLTRSCRHRFSHQLCRL